MDDFYIKWGRSEYADGGSNGSKGKSDQAHGRSINQEQVPDSRKRLSEPARASKTNNSEEPSRAILAGCCTDLSPEKHARAMSELRGQGTVIEHSRSSSLSALRNILEKHAG